VSTQSRQERRAQARAQREAAEKAAAQSEQRRKRLTILGGIVVAAVVIVVAVVVIAGSGGSDSKTAASGGNTPVANAGAIQEQLGGIPQKGDTLGRANAPITIVEYGDLQCPVCANFSNTIMPQVVNDYIRTGKARFQYREFPFIGDDSDRMARFSLAAAQQNKLFNFNELVYANQGEENTGYATDDYIRKVAASIPGLDVDKAMKDRNSQAVSDKLGQDQQLGNSLGVNATPTIYVGRSGQTPQQVDYTQLPDVLKQLTA